MDYQFCNFNTKEEKEIFEILNISFEVKNFESILKTYKVFRDNFNNPSMPLSLEVIKRDELKLRTNDLSLTEKLSDLNYHLGVDLPILIRPNSVT